MIAFRRTVTAKLIAQCNTRSGRDMLPEKSLPCEVLRCVSMTLPGHSPDFNPDEAIWDWIREDVTANTCFGTAAKARLKAMPSWPGWPSARPR